MATPEAIIQQLLSKPALTPEEEEQLRLLLETEFRQNLQQYPQPATADKAQQILVKLQEQIAAENDIAPLKKPVVLYRWLAAAAMLLLLAAGWWYFTPATKQAAGGGLAQAVVPGTSGAVLTLANGRQIVLDSMGNGVVARENGATVTLHNHQLVYGYADSLQKETAMNQLVTPRGRQFQLLLPDGTKVWLNAASSIRYPVAFTGKERKVEITGEAYLEVAPQAHAPFKVTAGNMQLQVLGTAFNINAYADEPAIAATLTEGSVRVALQPAAAQKTAEIVLSPGQQARVKDNMVLVPEVDISAVLAWKNGQFSFEGAGVADVMRQIARWYNVEVRYEGVPPHREFHGGIGRDFTIQQVLDALEKTGVHCRLEDRTIIVEKSPV